MEICERPSGPPGRKSRPSARPGPSPNVTFHSRDPSSAVVYIHIPRDIRPTITATKKRQCGSHFPGSEINSRLPITYRGRSVPGARSRPLPHPRGREVRSIQSSPYMYVCADTNIAYMFRDNYNYVRSRFGRGRGPARDGNKYRIVDNEF